MDITHAHLSSQRVLKQRNGLAIVSIALTIVILILFIMASTRDREIVLQPISRSPLTLSSAGVSREYLEMVTRDVALLALNRSPETLKYWMDNILEMTDPRSRGQLKSDLIKVVEEQRGSQITQFFTINTIRTDPEALTSDVIGVLHTVAGSKEVTTQPRTFRFTWTYTGVSLKLRGFGIVEKVEKSHDADAQ
ncbi:type IV conjugative transfer system protein TraE [Novosphingobium sp. 9U]|uniref:type IV conjugative transfer system protein TraE n=1 Tax=Novosphingobium sp. 9U TaxID=2653158 RepID=UPI0012F1E34A|nr:type IV conjugative transfer system protein TraE [Novosphingobium sp. 9U]VWX49822.1 Conjugal transfer protein TraE [Novosphingobium sp. 9U]